MEVKRKTPRTEMVYNSLVIKMSEIFESVAEDLGLSPLAVDKEMARFAALSARLTAIDCDFELADVGDEEDALRAKFLKYVETEDYLKVEDIFAQIAAMDRPVSKISGPEEPEEKN